MLTTVIGWATVVGCFLAIYQSYIHQGVFLWEKLADWGRLVIIFVALMLGEQWFANHGTIPWFGTYEKHLQARSDYIPIVFLLITALAIRYFAGWFLHKAAKAYTESKRMKGSIPPPIVALIVLILSFYPVGVLGSYHVKVSDNPVGTMVISAVRNGVSGLLQGAADAANEEASQAAEDDAAKKTNTKKKPSKNP